MSDTIAAPPATVKLVPVLPDVVNVAWPHLSAIVEMALEGEKNVTADDVRRMASNGECALWAVVDGDKALAAVAHVIWNYPQSKALRIIFCGGKDKARWVHLLSEIEEFARRAGCAAVEAVARKGWAKVLPDYRLTHVLLRREI